MVDLPGVSRRDKESGGCRIVFVIIRPMLYGKATTIHALYKALMPQNVVIFQDFRDFEDESFDNTGEFSWTFATIDR